MILAFLVCIGMGYGYRRDETRRDEIDEGVRVGFSLFFFLSFLLRGAGGGGGLSISPSLSFF